MGEHDDDIYDALQDAIDDGEGRLCVRYIHHHLAAKADLMIVPRHIINAHDELVAALENVPLPSTMGGWGEFIPRFYDWLNGQRDAALAKATGGK